MSDSTVAAVPVVAGEMRLRKPERRLMGWVPQCPDDLVASAHRGRTVAAQLDLQALAQLPELRQRQQERAPRAG